MTGALTFSLFMFLPTVAAPPMPYVSYGACPFECCTYGQWIAVAPLTAYVEERDTRRIAFKIAEGDTFLAITGNVHVLRPGAARVTRALSVGGDSLRMSFAVGDTIWLLDYVGEGIQNIWYRGAVRGMETESWGGHWEPPPDHPAAKFIRETTSEWWVQVQNRRGQVGWIKMPDDGIPTGADGCG